ncbi:hypothetical protein D3C81_902050 [compost metagenome]
MGRQRGAIYFDHDFIFPIRGCMDTTGDQFLSRPRFTCNQNSSGSTCNERHQVIYLLHRLATANNFRKIVNGLDLLF